MSDIQTSSAALVASASTSAQNTDKAKTPAKTPVKKEKANRPKKTDVVLQPPGQQFWYVDSTDSDDPHGRILKHWIKATKNDRKNDLGGFHVIEPGQTPGQFQRLLRRVMKCREPGCVKSEKGPDGVEGAPPSDGDAEDE